MRRNSMYFDTQRTKICKDIYRPSTNVFRFIRSVLAVLVVGESPISHRSKRKMH
ncbi:MAG TPA: hypothetical protein VM012_10670 [Flavitalea sp.]|nr:hypothetical protein [Flavitalea sp.]